MSYSCLPIWPLLLFGVIEPALCAYADFIAFQDPFKYFLDQAPNYPTTAFSPQAEALTLQTGNVLLLLAAMALICCWTTHSEITKWYLFAVAIADLGHIYGSYRGVGPEYFWNISDWNDMIAGSVGVSVFLNVNRWLTLLGTFGTIRADNAKEKTS